MQNVIRFIERSIVFGVLSVLSVILVLAFIDIVYEIKQRLLLEPRFIIDSGGLMELFSLFLILLIGLELLETVKAYLKEDIVHVEFIILVAIIAISRKVIVWDFNKYSDQELISLAIMVLALGITYFLVKNSGTGKIKLRQPKSKD